MGISEADHDLLRDHEESMWREDTRFDQAHMHGLLADDFVEFGRSGRTYTRLECLAIPDQPIRAVFPLEGFEVRLLNAETALVTYVSHLIGDDVERSNRSSIWSRTSDGWKLRFHQGTPRAD